MDKAVPFGLLPTEIDHELLPEGFWSAAQTTSMGRSACNFQTDWRANSAGSCRSVTRVALSKVRGWPGSESAGGYPKAAGQRLEVAVGCHRTPRSTVLDFQRGPREATRRGTFGL